MTDPSEPVVQAERAADRAEDAADRADGAAEHVDAKAREVVRAVEIVEERVEKIDDSVELLHDPEQDPDYLGQAGRPLNRHSPFIWGLLAAAGVLLAWWLGGLILQIGSVLILIVVALFLAVGLNPLVEFLMRRGLKRSWSVLIVIVGVVIVLALFVVAIAPVISSQFSRLGTNLPHLLDQLQSNSTVRRLDDKYHFISKIQDYVNNGGLTQKVFGGVLGLGLAVLGFLANAFVVLVLTLYFLASLPSMKHATYQLAPASRRERVSLLGDRILRNVGGYVSGAFVVALCAGLSTLIFLFIVGLGQYAVALALLVALLDVIPMIGATIGAVVVCAIGLATDPTTGLICIAFYIAYQQVENYVLYPRVMARSVEIPGALTGLPQFVGRFGLG